MSSETTKFDVINDGTFSLDPGAAFGVTPKNVWSKEFQPNDNYRISLNCNICVISMDDKHYLIDSGIGNNPGKYLEKWFEAKPNRNLENYMKKNGIEKFEAIFHTHLHFDHMGHSFTDLSESKSYAHHLEIENFRKPEDFAAASYTYKSSEPDVSNLIPLFSDTRTGNFELIHTGGHTTGHMAIIFHNESLRLMFLGDLAPTTFQLKPTRLTAIDSEPLKSMKAKKILLKKVIREEFTLILSHDQRDPVVEIKGEPDQPNFERVF